MAFCLGLSSAGLQRTPDRAEQGQLKDRSGSGGPLDWARVCAPRGPWHHITLPLPTVRDSRSSQRLTPKENLTQRRTSLISVMEASPFAAGPLGSSPVAHASRVAKTVLDESLAANGLELAQRHDKRPLPADDSLLAETSPLLSQHAHAELVSVPARWLHNAFRNADLACYSGPRPPPRGPLDARVWG